MRIDRGTSDLLSYSGAKVSRSAAQTGVLTATFTLITWTVEDWDEGGWWDAGAPTKLTVPAGVGKVSAKTNVSYQSNATGRRVLHILKNGVVAALIEADATAGGGNRSIQALAVDIAVAAGDYLEAGVYQDSGSTLTVGGDICSFSAHRLDD